MDEPVLVSATPAASERRRLTVLVAVGAALVLGALVVPKVLGGGSSDGSFDSAPLVTTTTVATPAPAQAETAAHSGKDPFRPLVTPRAPEKAAPPVVVTTPAKTVVRVQDVYVDKAYRPAARLTVDKSELVVRVGQQFNGSYRVLSLDVNTKCGQFLFGDQPFDLCTGEATSF